ncbi:MAG: hypothetical protein ACI959_002255, partial [Limisphaerales bacterium]
MADGQTFNMVYDSANAIELIYDVSIAEESIITLSRSVGNLTNIPGMEVRKLNLEGTTLSTSFFGLVDVDT